MKSRSFLLPFLLLLPLALLAQQSGSSRTAVSPAKSTAPRTSKPMDPEAAKVADIRRLLALTGTREMVNQMKTEMMSQFRQNAPTMPREMFDEMTSELKAEDLEEAMIPVYSKHFTGADIKQLIAFYESPFGRKVMREMPQIITESNEVGIRWGQGVITKVAGRWRDQGKISQRAYDQLVGAAEEEH